jgi:PncC family amidohydrolase
MAQGARERTGADLAVAVTGVSGPGGGTEAKPVGLTYVAVAHPNGVEVRRYVWPGDRAANREASARAAVELLLECAGALAAADESA